MSFSVVVTNWNRADVLSISLMSILCQKHISDLEILLVDDASTDNSLEVAKEFKRSYPRIIRLFETHENLRHSIVLPANIGFKRAKYDMVVLNPSDIIQVLDTNFRAYMEVLSRDANAWAGPYLVALSTWQWRTEPAQAGGCTLKQQLHRVTGFDERMFGWGSDEPDLFDRLRFAGVRLSPCNSYVIHMDRKVGAKRETWPPGANGPIHQENYDKHVISPNKVWGEHPKLEEIL